MIKNLKLNNSWVEINKNFPFKNYINKDRKSGYFDMVKKVSKWIKPGGKILDFGCGPCDKTAMFSLSGYNVTAYDTFEDAWHKQDKNNEKIFNFAKKSKIKLITGNFKNLKRKIKNEKFDVIMAHDVFEHFHSSPRIVLNHLLSNLKTEGYLIISVPNAANLRKRISIFFGRTNYNRYDYFYWYPGFWNGHVREYVKNDLEQLNFFLKLDKKEISSYHLQLDVLPSILRKPFVLISNVMPSIRDTWMLVSAKPKSWKPQFIPSKKQIKKSLGWHYFDISKYKYNWFE